MANETDLKFPKGLFFWIFINCSLNSIQQPNNEISCGQKTQKSVNKQIL